MTVQQQVLRSGRPRRGRLGRALPWIGTAIAVLALVSRVRRKGFVRGAADTALDAVPVVGALKGFVEAVRGRDFFPDRVGG